LTAELAELYTAIEDVQARCRARRADAHRLASACLAALATVHRVAAELGVAVESLDPTGVWWDPATYSSLESGELTVVELSSSGPGFRPCWHVRRHGHLNRIMGRVRICYPATGVAPPAPRLDADTAREDRAAREAAETAAEQARAEARHALVLARDHLDRSSEHWSAVHAGLGELEEELEGAAAVPAEIADPVSPKPRLVAVLDHVEEATRILRPITSVRCQVCGCSEADPCETEDGPCGWSARHPAPLQVCTACGPIVDLILAHTGASLVPPEAS
jgi:hypothetical protein